jgi:Zn-finger nucleic acid-binding protein
MDALFISALDGGTEIEIDRCAQCGSLWFDAGELEVAANVHARPSAAESEYPCPVCRQRMRGASLPRGLHAHRCDSCQGTFLEGSTVTALGSERLPRVPDQAPKQASVGFLCARCHQRFPFARGNGTSLGLMCPECVVNPQVEPITSGPTSDYRVPSMQQTNAGLDLAYALTVIFDLFSD